MSFNQPILKAQLGIMQSAEWSQNTTQLWSLVIKVRKLGESISSEGYYIGQTKLELDSLSFLTR